MKKFNKYGLTFYKGVAVENNDEAYQIAQELVEELFCLLSKKCTKFCNEKYDFFMPPYMYTERRLDGVLMPALTKLCDSIVMTELPVLRKIGNDDYIGRADYWCIYKGYSFVIELKHSKDNYQTPTTSKHAIVERWRKMIKQLNSVKRDALEFDEKTKGVIRLGLHMISSRCSQSIDAASKFDESKINEISDRMYKDLTGKSKNNYPDLILCWKIPTNMVKKGSELGFDTYPGLWTFAKIYPPLEHVGMQK
jgi:hypothetical protein